MFYWCLNSFKAVQREAKPTFSQSQLNHRVVQAETSHKSVKMGLKARKLCVSFSPSHPPWRPCSARHRAATASSGVGSSVVRRAAAPSRRAPAARRAPGRLPAAAAGWPTAPPATAGEKETGRRWVQEESGEGSPLTFLHEENQGEGWEKWGGPGRGRLWEEKKKQPSLEY